mgnify:CR=1 FL=1
MNINVKQRNFTDCGAACLASVAKYYKLNVLVARIRKKAGTDSKGTNVLGLIEAARDLGFDAKGVKGPYESLFKIPKPAIAHVIVREVHHHFVVICKIRSRYIEIMDPADGLMHRKTHAEFKKEWSGVLLLLMPADDFRPNEGETIISRFWVLVKPHRPILLQVLFGALIYTILGLSASIFVQKIVDFVLVYTDVASAEYLPFAGWQYLYRGLFN